MDFIERLHNNCLTSIEDYRKMQVKLHAMKQRDQPLEKRPVADDWKNWELAPVDSANSVKAKDSSVVESTSEAARGLHKALRTIDKF